MTPDPTAIARHREALRRVVVEHPELTVQDAYRLADKVLEAEEEHDSHECRHCGEPLNEVGPDQEFTVLCWECGDMLAKELDA
jgi:hypothetical protein